MTLSKLTTQLTIPWAKSIQETLSILDVSPRIGLSKSQVQERLEIYGQNILKAEKKTSPLIRFLLQFKNPAVIILLIATSISATVGDIVDAIAIATIVIINAVIGFIQEAKADTAVEALKKLVAPHARVLREGRMKKVHSSFICLGDILLFEAGDYVPADCRIIEASQLSADEGALTGESLPVTKDLFLLPEKISLGERLNMLFAGTVVTTGTGKVVVTSTGMNTEIGQIAEMLEITEETKTPLQERLAEISNKLLIFCLAIVIVVALLGVYQGDQWLEILMNAVSLAVAAIPEGLATVVTLTLVLGIQRLSKRNAIVRYLPAVETLGSTNVICTDKTGTLTTGKMRVRETFTLMNGIIKEEEGQQDTHDAFQQLMESAVLCSNASITNEGLELGDPTEVALLYLANTHSLEQKTLNETYPKLAEWSFDSNRKRMSVAVRVDNKVVIHCKGAPEAVLPLCQLSSEEEARILEGVETLSSQGRRILCVASKIMPESFQDFDIASYKEDTSIEKNLTFLGLVSIADPPRQESIAAIKECKAAGIKVVMITGDHPITAKAIARELGIVMDDKADLVLTGIELDAMSTKDFEERVETTAVYARVSPQHKLKIVQALIDKGNIVAMTGDGVNDAPALKQASIGIAMGKGGTEVARQASTMILTDDNFATIVSAIKEGRAIYANIRRTIQYLTSGNLALLLIIFGTALAGWPVPLAPIHLLWINLVTETLPGLALATEPVPDNILQITKRPSSRMLLDRAFYQEIIFVGVLTTIMALSVYAYMLDTAGSDMAKTYVFSFLVFSDLFRSFAYRNAHKTIFQMGVTSNLYLLVVVSISISFQILMHYTDWFLTFFKVQKIDWEHCLILISLTLIPVAIIEFKKWVMQSKKDV